MRLLKIMVLSLMMYGCMAVSSPVSIVKTGGKESRGDINISQKISGSTVGLTAQGENGQIQPYCAGVWVGADRILTAHHCVAGWAEYNGLEEGLEMGMDISYVVQGDLDEVGLAGGEHLGKVIGLDGSHDLAIIEANHMGLPSHPIAVVSGGLSLVGSRAYIMGHPQGLYWSYGEVLISSYRHDLPSYIEAGKDGPFIQVSGNVWFGNSGGGLFNELGELIGICSMSAGVPNMSLFIGGESIRKFLKE